MEVESSGEGGILLAFGVDLEYESAHWVRKRDGVPAVAKEKKWRATESMESTLEVKTHSRRLHCDPCSVQHS